MTICDPESSRRQAELSYANETAAAARCCFCGSQTIRLRIGEGGRLDMSSSTHHRLSIEASTEGSGPGVAVALAVAKAWCVQVRSSTALQHSYSYMCEEAEQKQVRTAVPTHGVFHFLSCHLQRRLLDHPDNPSKKRRLGSVALTRLSNGEHPRRTPRRLRVPFSLAQTAKNVHRPGCRACSCTNREN